MAPKEHYPRLTSSLRYHMAKKLQKADLWPLHAQACTHMNTHTHKTKIQTMHHQPPEFQARKIKGHVTQLSLKLCLHYPRPGLGMVLTVSGYYTHLTHPAT